MTEFHSEIWFRKVFDLHYVHLRNYLFFLSGDMAWSEDAVQEVFLILWEKRHEVYDQTLLPFLFKISRNLFLKQKRREEVHLRFVKKQDLSERSDASEMEMEWSEFDMQLQSALSALSERCRTVFLMSRTDEMSNRQIAEGLGISVKAVEKQITKALKTLREKLQRSV
jgi:RNA polymerase sigma-70 factor (ECF subfamily)